MVSIFNTVVSVVVVFLLAIGMYGDGDDNDDDDDDGFDDDDKANCSLIWLLIFVVIDNFLSIKNVFNF